MRMYESHEPPAPFLGRCQDRVDRLGDRHVVDGDGDDERTRLAALELTAAERSRYGEPRQERDTRRQGELAQRFLLGGLGIVVENAQVDLRFERRDDPAHALLVGARPYEGRLALQPASEGSS